ncbi:GFA family protein [Thalassospira sp. SM2505]|uniref:Aldehyde-activating protein n=1 Tax=Thalassospira profundimaris TaxID=502049 RepID=A0A367WQU9_9PROT|nr:GFA family protein [Thalassospira profundimaris]RCK43845.1 aldehyde-activating protein [Thalassospira profundimaris]
MSEKHSGSCLCGQVTFEVTGTFDAFFLCHCKYCQKDTGSAHAANLFSQGAKLSWLTGKDKVTSFTLPGTRHAKSFCSACGSAVPGEQMGGKLVVVPAGSLDTPVTNVPDAHIMTGSKANWDDGLERVTKVAGMPG